MRLVDLDAEFLGGYNRKSGRASYRRQANAIDGAQGVIFQCPKCAEGEPSEVEDGRRYVPGAHYVLVWFAVPRGADPVPPDATPGPARWSVVSGTGLDDLTLAPSILLPGPGCGWHGFVKNGDAT